MLKFMKLFNHLNEFGKDINKKNMIGLHRIVEPKDALEQMSFIKAKYENYILQISELLNGYHHKNYSKRYWEIILGFWLLKLISIIYDKYLIVDDLYGLKINSTKYPEDIKPMFKLANPSTVHYRKDWNQYLLYRVNQIKNHDENNDESSFLGVKISLISIYVIDSSKNLLRRILRKEKRIDNLNTNGTFQVAITADIKHILCSDKSYNLIKKIIADKDLFFYEDLEISSLNFPNKTLRKKLFDNIVLKDDFDKCFWILINDFFPTFYIEEYKKIAKKSREKYHWAKVDTIFTSHEVTESILCNFFIAHQMENHNSKLIGIQHGGGYGLSSTLQIDLEIKLSDYFVTWGWGDEKDNKFIKMPCLKMDNIYTDTQKLDKKNILYVTATTQPYYNYIGIGTNWFNAELYNNNISKIMNALLRNKNINIEWRPYTARVRKGENSENYVIKKIRIDYLNRIIIETSGSFYKKVTQCRLFLCDHLGTTMLEALNANIPTILILEKEWDVVSDEMENSLKVLASANILFYSIDKAAQYIDQIWDDINYWWEDERRQRAKDEFVKTFSNKDTSMIESYYKLFKDIKKEIGVMI